MAKTKVTEASILAACGRIHKNGQAFQRLVQRTTLDIFTLWSESGNVQQAINLVERLTDSLPEGSRTNALRDYVKAATQWDWDESEKKWTYSKSTTKIDLKAAAERTGGKNWYDFTKEAEYKPFDLEQKLHALVAMAIKRAEKTDERDNIDLSLLEKLQKVA